jgi:hypothetical protein
MTENSKPPDDGFELPTGKELPDGTKERMFYRWHVSDGGKDLMLIDRFTGMPIQEFFETIEDSFDRGRAPILLALMATSIRNRHQDWSVERIVRTVQNVNLSDVEFIDADVEESAVPPPPQEETTGSSSSSESKPLSSDPEDSPVHPVTSETSPVTLA